MKARIILGLFLVLVAGIPMLLLNVGVLGTKAQVDRALSGGTDVPRLVESAGVGIADAFGRFAEGQEISTIFDTELLARARHVIHEQTLRIEDVLRDGEEPPVQGLEKLWITARANALAMPECDRILQTLAKTCGVSKSTVTDQKDGSFVVASMLSYVPSYYLGEIDVEGARDLYTKRIEIPASEAARDVSDLATLPGLRVAYYEAARQACRDLRRETRNCVVTEINPNLRSVNGREGSYQYYLDVKLQYVGARAAGSNESLMGWLASDGAESAEDVEERAGMLDALSGFLSGGSDSEEKQPAKPGVLRGGGAFRSAN